jgi:hypothetical protein
VKNIGKYFGKKHYRGTGNICSGASPGGCRHWPKEISPNELAAGLARLRGMRTCAWSRHRIFFIVDGERVRTTRGDRSQRDQDSRLPLPGTLLTRQWKGRTLLVEVLARGFRYENRHYSSLSAIAVAVTGTRWNGLAFFGLTRAAGAERKERPHAEN